MVAEQYSLEQPLPEIIQQYLKPIVKKIDEEAYYPAEFLTEVGQAGLLYGQGSDDKDVLSYGLQLMETIAETCMTTGFAFWCHIAALIYIRHSDNEFLKNTVLPKIESGQIRGGSGLSNPLKELAKLEKLCLKTKRVEGGYIVSGRLPFVSNIGKDAWFAVIACQADGREVMVMVPGDAEGLTLQEKREFLGLNGCATCACIFENVFIPDTWVIARDARAYIKKVRSQFLLYQIPLGIGVTESCVRWIKKARHKQGGCNQYLPVQANDLEEQLETLRDEMYRLAQSDDLADKWLELLQLRLDVNRLTSQATHTRMVHHGGSGYLRHSDSFRRLREAYFLISLTPTERHLEKILHAHDNISV